MSIGLGDIEHFYSETMSMAKSIDYAVSFLPNERAERALDEHIKTSSNFYHMSLEARELAEKEMAKIECWHEKYRFLLRFCKKGK